MPLRMTSGLRITPTTVPSPPLCAFQAQVRPKWCWAACVAMVVDSLHRPQRPTQCEIAGAHIGRACCGLPRVSCVGAGGNACDKTCHPDDIDALWAENHVPAQRQEFPLTLAQLDDQILNVKRPVMVYLEGGNATFDHVMLVVGKHDATWFVVADPCLNNFTVATHEELLRGRAGWHRTWINLR